MCILLVVVGLGFALIGVEAYLFARVERELGSRRLIGHAELTGTGEMFAGGLYAHVRHPRYLGMFSAVVGAALIAGTPLLWMVMAIWWVFALLVIRLEEDPVSKACSLVKAGSWLRLPPSPPDISEHHLRLYLNRQNLSWE